MLDLHAVTSGGSTGALGGAFVVALGGDGQTVQGVPINPNATLLAWGMMTTIADTINVARLQSQDQVDPLTGELLTYGAGSLHGHVREYTKLPYTKGLRQLAINQNTAAAACLGWLLDAYDGGDVVAGSRISEKKVCSAQVMAALAAVTWGTTPFAPAQPLPAGKYAILGAWVSALTNYGLIRFQHSDFKGYAPGFPVVASDLAIARANCPVSELDFPGYQFVHLSEITKKPCCPVFTVSNTGTGLLIQALSITVVTPVVTLCLAQVG